jgi:hypothetical protein
LGFGETGSSSDGGGGGTIRVFGSIG